MRTSFLRVLGTVAVSAAVVGSVFASVWLLSGSTDRSQALRAAAGTSSSVVHAALPTAAPAVKHAVVRTVHVRAAASRGFTAPATAHVLKAQARPVARVIPQRVVTPTTAVAPVTTTTSAPQPKAAPKKPKAAKNPAQATAPKTPPADPAKPLTSVSSASLAKVSSNSKTASKTTAADKRTTAAPVRPASVESKGDKPKDAALPKSGDKGTDTSNDKHGSNKESHKNR